MARLRNKPAAERVAVNTLIWLGSVTKCQFPVFFLTGIFMHPLRIVHEMNIYRADDVCLSHIIQLKDCSVDLDEIFYFAIGYNPKVVLFNPSRGC
jgi:hypothetical protein